MKKKIYNVTKALFSSCMALGFMVSFHGACVLFFGEQEYPTEK